MPHRVFVSRPLALVVSVLLSVLLLGVISLTAGAEGPTTPGEPPAEAREDGAEGEIAAGTLAMTADGEWEDDAWADEWDDWDDELDSVPSGYADPFEPVNRVTLSFNNAIDRLVLDQVTRLYRFSLPQFARSALVRILNNVNSPQVFVNDGLQLEWKDAGVITSRMLVNSTAGVGGIFDVGRELGLEHHESDFGQTLTLAGVPAGTYLMLPLFGPANMRDAVGIGVDALLHPTFYLLPGTDLLLFGGSAGVVTRARHFEELQALKESSVDVYSAMRSGYYQNRQAQIWGRRESRRPSRDEDGPDLVEAAEPVSEPSPSSGGAASELDSAPPSVGASEPDSAPPSVGAHGPG